MKGFRAVWLESDCGLLTLKGDRSDNTGQRCIAVFYDEGLALQVAQSIQRKPDARDIRSVRRANAALQIAKSRRKFPLEKATRL